jgi:hypothetical protein
MVKSFTLGAGAPELRFGGPHRGWKLSILLDISSMAVRSPDTPIEVGGICDMTNHHFGDGSQYRSRASAENRH